MNNSVIVSLRDIVVEFDGQRILDGLNLDIHDKEFVTLLGPSGCGKTTTLRLIAGFLEPTSGKVLLKGEDITGVPPYKRPVNTVFQKYALFPHLNVFENVAFGLRLKKMDEETIRRKVRDMLEVVGLKGFERRSIGQMSGGQQQRVAIARSLVNEPEIQQALIDVRDGLQRVVDQFNQTGMRDIDSLIEIVGELRDITDKLTAALQELQGRLGTSDGTVSDLADELEVSNSLSTIYKTLDEVIKAMDNVPGLMNQFSVALGSYSSQQLSAYMRFTEAREMLKDYENQLEDAKQLYEESKEKALASADVAKQLDIKTLAQLIYAQNFSMPAGYVADKSGESWLLKVGEEYDSVSDIEGALLLHVDGFGDVRLSDVADVAVIDNAEASYTRLNGERAVVLKIFRNANSSASSVSDGCLNAFKELQAQYSDLHVVVLSNQGNYITIIVNSIISSMLVGAALAIIVLAIFLKDIKPTLVVGVSIPLSVLFAVVLMYFTGLDMNIMTLAGLSLGVGMLVDNSVVVIENIYRLRSRGVPRAQSRWACPSWHPPLLRSASSCRWCSPPARCAACCSPCPCASATA